MVAVFVVSAPADDAAMVSEREHIFTDFLSEGFDAYVFFTLSGKEEELAEELNGKYKDIYCLALKRMVHRSNHGRKWDEEAVMIKGYVFVYVPLNYDIKTVRSDNHPYHILRWKLELGKLFGDDYSYAKWVLEQDGLLGISKAVRINEKVKIIEGPLAELEGYIVRYSPRNRNCLVELTFMNQQIRTWLPFEWTDQNYRMD